MSETAEFKDTATAQKYYDQGLEAEKAHDRQGAIQAYRAAFTADPDNPDVCFRLAYNLDLVGEEDEALSLYEQATSIERPHLNALMNLAILFEDRNDFTQAERCLQQVLATSPAHVRARLFLKDVQASRGMVIDDEQEKIQEKHSALLDTPVTDFELSVRTRNALRKMSIRTLGDLLKVTESEMRSFKNFGDASLDEIKAMLAQKGLRLGEAVEQHQAAVKEKVFEQIKELGHDEQVVSRSTAELDLSVRARKALSLLNVTTIGDLLLKTEAELMGVKNFGMTSLVEIKEALTKMNLSLRDLDE